MPNTAVQHSSDVHRRSPTVLLVVAMLVMLVSAPRSQEAAPQDAFKGVHCVNLTTDEAKLFLAALADVNAVLEQAGHSDSRYHLYRVVGKQLGGYSYMWESAWPSNATFEEVVNSPAFLAALKRHPITERIRKNEIYNRYVEATSSKP